MIHVCVLCRRVSVSSTSQGQSVGVVRAAPVSTACVRGSRRERSLGWTSSYYLHTRPHFRRCHVSQSRIEREMQAHVLLGIGAASLAAALTWTLMRARRKSQDRRGHTPKRLILVRHGESEGNVDHNIYEHTADSASPHTACYMRHAKCGMLNEACCMLHAACYMRH